MFPAIKTHKNPPTQLIPGILSTVSEGNLCGIKLHRHKSVRMIPLSFYAVTALRSLKLSISIFSAIYSVPEPVLFEVTVDLQGRFWKAIIAPCLFNRYNKTYISLESLYNWLQDCNETFWFV